jgi:hypothetical protein
MTRQLATATAEPGRLRDDDDWRSADMERASKEAAGGRNGQRAERESRFEPGRGSRVLWAVRTAIAQ